MKPILIAYATATNSTKDVAESIGNVLQDAGHSVVISEINQPVDLADYSAVIVGAPINGFKWLPVATQFINAQSEELRNVPVALFALSYFVATTRESIRAKMRNALKAESDAIGAKAVHVFGGKLANTIPAFPRFFLGIPKSAPADARDWNEIAVWAEELSNNLLQ